MIRLLFILLVRLAVTSATQVGYLDALGHEADIVASTTPSQMYNLRHPVVDLGSDMDLNIEALLRAHPDIVLLTDYGTEPKGANILTRAGIRIVMMREWKETDPIARAGWLREVAALVGEEARADSILAVVTARYTALRDSVRAMARPVPVLSGQNYRGTWYVPTVRSYMGRLIIDAGGVVADGEGSKPLTTERVVRDYIHAPVWIGAQASSLSALAQIDAKHTWFDAYKRHAVYSWEARRTDAGANDFWETGAVRADILLADIIAALRGDEHGYFLRKLP